MRQKYKPKYASSRHLPQTICYTVYHTPEDLMVVANVFEYHHWLHTPAGSTRTSKSRRLPIGSKILVIYCYFHLPRDLK